MTYSSFTRAKASHQTREDVRIKREAVPQRKYLQNMLQRSRVDGKTNLTTPPIFSERSNLFVENLLATLQAISCSEVFQIHVLFASNIVF